ncbi:MAG: hypothetical protein RDV48_06055 [Candidatus Eremiobacteraeota bacterium]|nr:hypothetical protein [Candidatus Eremiobacteraeota bacterium]
METYRELWNHEPVMAFFMTVLALAAGGAVVYWIVRAYAANAINPRITLSPEKVKRGQELSAVIEFSPRMSLELDMIEVTITCERTFREHRAGDRHHHYEKDTLCKETTYIPVGKMVKAGETCSYSSNIAVPRDGLPTKRKSFGWDEEQAISIEWYVTVRFDIKQFPDAINRYSIIVEG